MKTIFKLFILSMLALSFGAFADTGEQTTPPDPSAVDCGEGVEGPGTVEDEGASGATGTAQ